MFQNTVFGRTWRLRPLVFVLISILFPTSVGFAAEYEDVHKCDVHAAHPSDPQRWAQGVLDEDIVPGPAIAFCRRAVDEHSETPRFLFQFGRALWAGQRFEEGLEVFRTLEETYDYPPVYAYLADAYMQGIGGTEINQELAVSLYQIAADSGFEPAAEVLANFDPSSDPEIIEGQSEAAVELEPTVTNRPTEEAALDESWFNRADIVGAFNSGNFAVLRDLEKVQVEVSGLSGGLLPIYLNSFVGQFEGTYNYKDPNCVYLYSPRIASRLKQMFIDSAHGGKGLGMGNNLAAGMNMILKYMQDVERTGGRGLINQQINLDLLKQSAEQDAGKLIVALGCDSETVKRIYGNIEAYIFGANPLYSPEEEIRQAEIRQQAAEEREKQRQSSLRTNANASCVIRFKKQAYCDCLVISLDETGISDASWADLGKDFGTVLQIAKGTDDFASKLKSCRLKG